MERYGEDESERRLDVIVMYKYELDSRNRLQEEIETGKKNLEALMKKFKETGDDLKYLTTTRAEWIGEILKPFDEERYVVKRNERRRYIVICCSKVDKSKLISGTRVTLERKLGEAKKLESSAHYNAVFPKE